MHNEVMTLQRINEGLREDHARVTKKHEHINGTLTQVTQELEKARKQLFEQITLTQTQKFDIEAL